MANAWRALPSPTQSPPPKGTNRGLLDPGTEWLASRGRTPKPLLHLWVPVGYCQDDESTGSTLVDGWLHTGDLARVDEDGYAYITGRAKDMILTGGLNVYPAEMEQLIQERPEVLEAAVIAVPHSEWGEIGKASIVLKPGQVLDEDTLLTELRKDLASFKVPRLVEFTETLLPRTMSGKLKKFLLT